MENKSPISSIMGITMDKIKEMVDVNTIIGEPIQIDESTTIIPVSKVSVGFASGGSDLPSKQEKELFGGGSGAGVSIQPVAFLVVHNGDAKLIPVNINPAPTSALVNLIPEVIDKVTGMLGKNNSEAAETAEQE